MARARNIKPSFFTNELLGTEDPMVSLTFAGLWCLADKVGILEDRPLRVKAELFPYREKLDVNGYLSVLARHGFIVRYENSGKRYIQVLNFRKHQSPHHTEKAKGMPFFTDPKSLILEGNGYGSVNEPLQYSEEKVSERSDSLIPDSLIEDSLIHKSSCDQQAESPKVGQDRIDYKLITQAFRKNLGALPQPRDMTEKRRKMVRSIVKRGGRYAEPDFFPKFFGYVAKSDFLMGRGPKPWHGCCFDWLLKPENFQKIIEGNYHPESENA